MGWKSAAAFLALSLLGAGSLVYLLLHKDEETDYYFLKSSKTSVVEVKIPKESLGIVIGRRGNTIREIESKSNVTISITDDVLSNDFKLCIIRGTPENTQYAEFLIYDVIVSQPLIETFEMYIPVQACGRIIGRGGENVRMISRSSNAKLTLSNTLSSPVSFERKLTIKGTSEQIALAKVLVEQKLEEEKEFRNKLESHLVNRPCNKPKYLLPAVKDEERKTDSITKHTEKFIPTGSNGLLEVYVSAIESPDRMWLQMLGPSTVDLDRLNEEMTDYYSKDKNKEFHKLKEVRNGQIIAAPFAYDSKWYRAKVLEIQNKSDLEEPDVLLYYVDYGNSCICKKGALYELRTDFLRLRFQAIECMLAKIKPKESKWTDEAIELLGDLTHVALWKSLLAKIHTYKERPTRVKREGSPVPCVELYDSLEEKTVNVAEELVQKGYAVWEEIAESSRIDCSANKSL